MVWPWLSRKRAVVEDEAARGAERAPTVHETPTREFVAHIPADAYSVHEKPTREIEVNRESNEELVAELEKAADLAASDGLLTAPSASDLVDGRPKSREPQRGGQQ